MAQAIITIKIMPESPDVDLDVICEQALKKIIAFAGEGQTKQEKEPIAFGLVALKITFVMDEDKGTADDLEADIETLEGVQSVETIDVRRAIG